MSTIIFEFAEEGLCLPSGFSVDSVTSWLHEVARSEAKQISNLLYVFCTDAHLLEINQQYLNHDTLTDIITFPYNIDPIEAEIYVSLERVFENAETFSKGHKDLELARVMVHGLLHLCGYTDFSKAEKSNMRDKESHYLGNLFPVDY